MSNSNKDVPITQIRELLGQTYYKYGTFEGTSALDDFKFGHIEDYKDGRIYQNILDWKTTWSIKGFDLPVNYAVSFGLDDD